MVRVRLAPSPTGTLHIGTARTEESDLCRLRDQISINCRPALRQQLSHGSAWFCHAGATTKKSRRQSRRDMRENIGSTPNNQQFRDEILQVQ